MRTIAALAAAVLLAGTAWAGVSGGNAAAASGPVSEAASQAATLRDEARAAGGGDSAKAAAAIRVLRAAGQAGLDAMIAERALQLSGATPANDERERAAVDAVAMQKDATESDLYWYTDLDQAKAAAARTGKPILSLRMLGKLNEDLSCANSRFFRTTLYANKEIGGYLRAHFILHWQSVRPVPVVTIDMGDGRKLVRTIAGNSIHYVLDAKGRLVDGIPGLYGPAAFLRELQAAEDEAGRAGALDEASFLVESHAWDQSREQAIAAAFDADEKRAGVSGAAADVNDEGWKKIAALHQEDAVLDAGARELMARKMPLAVAMGTTMSKSTLETPLMKEVMNLQGSIAVDTVKNEYLMHATIYQWMGQAKAAANLKEFNSEVYAGLFKTPNSDPWLGLAPPDVYAAIDQGGVVNAVAKGEAAR